MTDLRAAIEAALEQAIEPGPVRERWERAAVDTMPCDCGACSDHMLTGARNAVAYALDHVRASLAAAQEGDRNA